MSFFSFIYFFLVSHHVVLAFKLQGNRLFLMSEKRTLPDLCVMFKIQKSVLWQGKIVHHISNVFFYITPCCILAFKLQGNRLFLISDRKDNDRFMCDIWSTKKCLVTRKDSASYLKCLFFTRKQVVFNVWKKKDIAKFLCYV